MSKRKHKQLSRSETLFRIMLGLVAASMVFSLIVAFLPSGSRQAPTPVPTWTLPVVSTSTPTITPSPAPFPTLGPTEPPPLSPTVEATEPPAGPELPTETPEITPPLTIAPPTAEATEPPAGPELPTVTPTLTITPTPTVTASGSSQGFTFAVCGDSRNNPNVYRRVLEAVATDGSEFLLHTGDMVNNGTEAQWQAVADVMASFQLPFFPVPGNHDALSGGLHNYLEYSGAPAQHYSFDREPVHFALADSHNGGISATELTWLRDDLGATSQPVKVVVLHHPPFDPDGTNHIMAYGNDDFMDLMVEQAVDYVFAGHIHAYAQEERDGVLYTITGGAGAPLYAQDHPQAFHHYLRVMVEDEDVSIEVVKV